MEKVQPPQFRVRKSWLGKCILQQLHCVRVGNGVVNPPMKDATEAEKQKHLEETTRRIEVWCDVPFPKAVKFNKLSNIED